MFLKDQFTDNRDNSTYLGGRQQTNKSYTFKSRNYIQKEKHGPYFEVSAIQASSAVLYTKDVTTQYLSKKYTDL